MIFCRPNKHSRDIFGSEKFLGNKLSNVNSLIKMMYHAPPSLWKLIYRNSLTLCLFISAQQMFRSFSNSWKVFFLGGGFSKSFVLLKTYGSSSRFAFGELLFLSKNQLDIRIKFVKLSSVKLEPVGRAFWM